ncbi:hypothetical protein FGO68_gene8061 [Halteria grandinella]|uniref:Uncharacterized protein n=1 Tax=Halteria grandinella TaxID=5974 RepID=A0A8J8NUM2_HALGN|nr:hypothetical protein FGO68_gene8061 [Halteria grandinella]
MIVFHLNHHQIDLLHLRNSAHFQIFLCAPQYYFYIFCSLPMLFGKCVVMLLYSRAFNCHYFNYFRAAASLPLVIALAAVEALLLFIKWIYSLLP